MMYGSWDMECDRQPFCNFGLFFAFFPPNNPENKNFEKLKKKTPGDIIILHKCTINDNHMMYGSWDMKCDRNKFLSFWAIFCPFYPSNNSKNQNFEKMKKKHLEISFYTSSQAAIKKSDTQDFCINQSCWLSRTTTWICWAIFFIRNFLYWRQQKIENLISQEIEVVWRRETPQNYHKTEVLGNFQKNPNRLDNLN